MYHRPQKTPVEKKVDDPEHSEIRIKYKKEEYEAIKKEYEKMIEDIEQEILYEDVVSRISELNEKLSKIISEYQIFISYNTNTNESL